MTEAQGEAAANSPDRPQLPLFYREPQLLSSLTQADWRLRDGDAAFAATTAFLPIIAGELAAASASYPIVFAQDAAAPMAVLGLEEVNLFVTDGQWERRAYVPAYVRRYPFGLVSTGADDGFALIIDTASERLVKTGDEGTALFENGQPSALTRQALEFCDAYRREARETQEFCAALTEQDLLIDQRADARLSDGRSFGVDGFRVVDAEKFQKLDPAVVAEWHTRGWLALVSFHLASLNRFRELLDRLEERTSKAAAGEPALN